MALASGKWSHRNKVGAVFFLATFLLAWPVFAAGPFTIEQVLSAPVPTDLVTSPKGDAIAWVQNASGVRNIWVATAPSYQAFVITRFTADDGQDISDLTWRPDSSAVVFTRGGGVNGRGEYPNPRSSPAGVQQEVWIASLSGGTSGGVPGETHKLGSGHEAVVAPDNSAVAWLAGGQIWWTHFNGKDPAARPEPLLHERGTAHELAWSPDSARLAFTSERVDHAFVGVYDLRGKALVWMDPSVDTDQSIAWSLDGKQIAFIRLAAYPSLFAWEAHREDMPWSIRVADPLTGKGREVWRAKEGVGSVFREDGSDKQLLWMAGDRIVFPWERDGWLHLYSLNASDGSINLLTPGNFEIEHVAPSSDRKSMVFSSNQDDSERRHLWQVPADGGRVRRLTEGQGIEWAPAPLADGHTALFHSDARQPPRAALRETDGTIRDLTPQTIPATFPEGSLVEPQPIVFRAADGMEVHGQVFLPPGPPAKHPAVLFFHGGSRRQMLLGWHYMEYYNHAYGLNQYLASQGYVVLSINYRGGIGYGMQFREAPGFGASGGAEYNDILGAGRYLQSRSDVDPQRIGAWGGSYGGYLTALALARSSDIFKVGVDLHGVHDWSLEIGRFPGDPERQAKLAKTAFDSSPLAFMKTWTSPVLVVQGDDDRNVRFSQSVHLIEALRRQGVPFEQLIFPDEVHEFLVFSHWLDAYHAASGYLAQFLHPEASKK